MTDRLRIHIQNSAHEAAAVQLTRAQLEEAVAGRPTLAGQLDITEASGATLPGAIADADVLFTAERFPLGAIRKAAPKLRWVQTTFAGVESMLDGTALPLANASGVHADKGGEFALAGALLLSYRIPQFMVAQAAERWEPVFTPTLRRRRVTILGVGAIGGGAAAALRPHGPHITGVTRSGKSDVQLDRVVSLDQLDDVLAETDILISTLPNTAETLNLIDRSRVDLLPEGAGIVVVGRAAVLDYDAIMDRLDAGTLSGAVLDVFPVEPVPAGHRIWSTPRLIVSPHCSVDDHSTYMDACLDIFLDNLERDRSGRTLANLVDFSRGY